MFKKLVSALFARPAHSASTLAPYTSGNITLGCVAKEVVELSEAAYKNWLVHNTLGHPLSALVSLLGKDALGQRIHDGTLPEEKHLEGGALDPVIEEVKDVYTTAALLLYQNLRILDLPLPALLSSADKYIERVDSLRNVLKEAGLYDAEREAQYGVYWGKYTQAGTNMARPEKKAAFLAAARADLSSYAYVDDEGKYLSMEEAMEEVENTTNPPLPILYPPAPSPATSDEWCRFDEKEGEHLLLRGVFALHAADEKGEAVGEPLTSWALYPSDPRHVSTLLRDMCEGIGIQEPTAWSTPTVLRQGDRVASIIDPDFDTPPSSCRYLYALVKVS